MHSLFKAGAAFALAALFLGVLPPPGPRWRDVAEELRQAQPQARMQAAVRALLSRPEPAPEKG